MCRRGISEGEGVGEEDDGPYECLGESMRIQKKPLGEQLDTASRSALEVYREKAVGDGGYGALLRYELLMLCCANLSGGVGYLLRRWLYGRILGGMGTRVIIGRGIALRHPGRITLGSRVALDDYILLDAGGCRKEGIHIGDDVIISRNCVVQGKSGPVRIGARSDIGCNTVITSVSGVFIGEAVLMAANCYLGGGRYYHERTDIPILDQGVYSEGPVEIGGGSWLGAGAIVLDGVKVGRNCVVGAGAVVTKDLPDCSVAVGVPARIVRQRANSESAGSEGSHAAAP